MRAKIWDLPTRLFHWLLVVTMTGSVVSIQFDEIEWHVRFAFATCTLLIFRLIWGFVGSETARFASFVRGPGAVMAYLRGTWTGAGHNPLGALSVLALLGVAAAQIATGVFVSNEDLFFDAPWASWIGSAGSRAMNARHELLESLLYIVVALHLGAIIFYRVAKRQNLVGPMITGAGETHGTAAPRMVSPLRALPVLAVAIFCAGLIFRYWII